MLSYHLQFNRTNLGWREHDLIASLHVHSDLWAAAEFSEGVPRATHLFTELQLQHIDQ